MKKRKKKTQTVAQLKKRAWKLLSEIVRRKYADSSGFSRCYTCGDAAHWSDLHAGHAIPGRTGAVLLDEDILRPQDAKCNIWGRGMHHIFAAKLIKEHSMDWWEAKLASAKQVKKWSRSDLLSKIEEYQAKIAALT